MPRSNKVPDKYRGSKQYLLAYSVLINAAKYRGSVTYQGVAAALGLPTSGHAMGKAVGGLAGEISEDEVNHGRPMIGALIVLKGTGLPGNGFFILAKTLGKFPGGSKAAKRKFWDEERNRVYEAWQ